MVIPTQNCMKKILTSTAFPTDLWEAVKISDPREGGRRCCCLPEATQFHHLIFLSILHMGELFIGAAYSEVTSLSLVPRNEETELDESR